MVPKEYNGKVLVDRLGGCSWYHISNALGVYRLIGFDCDWSGVFEPAVKAVSRSRCFDR